MEYLKILDRELQNQANRFKMFKAIIFIEDGELYSEIILLNRKNIAVSKEIGLNITSDNLSDLTTFVERQEMISNSMHMIKSYAMEMIGEME